MNGKQQNSKVWIVPIAQLEEVAGPLGLTDNEIEILRYFAEHPENADPLLVTLPPQEPKQNNTNHGWHDPRNEDEPIEEEEVTDPPTEKAQQKYRAVFPLPQKQPAAKVPASKQEPPIDVQLDAILERFPQLRQDFEQWASKPQ